MGVDFLLKQGRQLLEGRGQLLSLWQEIALNFYPERADFTYNRTLGEEFMESLATGYPVMVRRDLANSIGGMLRPTNKQWAHVRVDNWDQVDSEGRAWLERAGDRQRRAMYHRPANFSRMAKEADNDFAAFGQAVIQISLNSKANGLLYRTWHLRDVAWKENSDGQIDTVYRKWRAQAIDLVRLFPKTVHSAVREIAEKEPYQYIETWHCVVPSDTYPSDYNKRNLPFMSFYLDMERQHIMEEVSWARNEYVIPRWQTVSGTQYAYSPAVVVGLSDARTLQEMTITLLEAGEKAVTPPLLGVQGALRSDVNVMAGGITWVDREYDERLGEVLRPMTIDKNGIPLGFDMARDVREQLKDAFYLNKIGLPPRGGPDMTAYETGQRVQEYIREALPLFEPMEQEYNAPVVEGTFELLMANGVFGSPFEMPVELRGRNIEFSFESPLHDAIERAKSQQFLEATALVANAAGADPSAAHVFDVLKATREALLAGVAQASWVRSEAEVEERVQAEAQAQQQQMMLDQMQKGADIANKIGVTPSPAGTQGGGAI